MVGKKYREENSPTFQNLYASVKQPYMPFLTAMYCSKKSCIYPKFWVAFFTVLFLKYAKILKKYVSFFNYNFILGNYLIMHKHQFNLIFFLSNIVNINVCLWFKLFISHVKKSINLAFNFLNNKFLKLTNFLVLLLLNLLII